MSFTSVIMPLITSIVIFIFAYSVLARFGGKRSRLYLLLWGIGLVFYGIGAVTQAYHGLWGWHPLNYRLWYLAGAILSAAWLGQGTIELLAPRKVAAGLLVLLTVASLYGTVRVFAATLDPAMLEGAELSGKAIVSSGVRVLTPFFNIYGTLALFGGAAWSAYGFYLRGTSRNRMIGNVLIALGALAPASGGTLSRFGFGGLYIGELLGAILLYVGFLKSSAPDRASQRSTTG